MYIDTLFFFFFLFKYLIQYFYVRCFYIFFGLLTFFIRFFLLHLRFCIIFFSFQCSYIFFFGFFFTRLIFLLHFCSNYILANDPSEPQSSSGAIF